MGRREEILNVAVSLFAKKGFAYTSTASIAKEAGVADGLVFHYFKSKKDILLQILTETSDSYIRGSRKRVQAASTGLEAIEAAIRFHFEFKQEHCDALLVLIRDMPEPLLQDGQSSHVIVAQKMQSILNLFSECIERGKQDGSIRNVATRETALMIHVMLNGLSRMRLLGPIEVPEVTSEVIDFCRRAIGCGDEYNRGQEE